MNFQDSGVHNLKGEKDVNLLLLLVITNLIIKAIPAGLLELGNDEVYYWTYALFPDWSHFDHPPMVGLLIQLFSFNLRLHSELFIRAGSLILSSANIIVLFYLVRRLYSRQSAFFAVIMYITSIYFNIISGLFILPDTPQIFFILLALSYLLPAVTAKKPTKKDGIGIFLFGLFCGLSFLSKYHSLFLWFGVGMYILLHNRIWLKKTALYLSVLATLILMIPVVFWNVKNEFISFTFQGGRIGLFHSPVNWITFLHFNLGQFLYQNPVLSVIYLLTLYNIFRKKKEEINETNLVLLYTCVPLILTFTVLSLFRNTLPHWTGPAFLCIIILSSEFLSEKYIIKRKKVIATLSAAALVFFLTLVLGFIQVNFGTIELDKNSESVYPGKNDFTLDMYGWKQAKDKFAKFLTEQGVTTENHCRLAIISNNWFPAAHLDYYIANPMNIRLLALGKIERIHKYFWINKTRKIIKTDRTYYITDSRNYHDPGNFKDFFNEIIPKDTLSIERNCKTVKYLYIYEMNDMKCDTIPD